MKELSLSEIFSLYKEIQKKMVYSKIKKSYLYLGNLFHSSFRCRSYMYKWPKETI